MSTQKQVKANRKNSKKSTGPKTDQGKAAVSQNAVKHGLFAQSMINGGCKKETESQWSLPRILYRLYGEKAIFHRLNSEIRDSENSSEARRRSSSNPAGL